jgi:ribosomal protein S18 acetylase RimI-like enzyme
VISFRPFRNTDPPAIAAIWNECFTGRGACVLRATAPLERFAFSKLFFDRAGLTVAFDDATPVGFVHAGFGPNEHQTGADPSAGVICALGVRPTFRNRGIGTELLRRGEDYLRSAGVRSIVAGPRKPNNPFYLGAYGGADSPGFLHSDPLARPFLIHRGYEPAADVAVLQRRLDRPILISDPRFAALRKSYEVVIQAKVNLGSWWLEGIVGAVEPVEIRLMDRSSNTAVGRSLLWEMEGFSWRWNVPAAGILEMTVSAERRRLGLGRFFLAHLLRYLQEQYFGVCECQVDEENGAAVGLLASMGFERVDEGTVYLKQGGTESGLAPA